MIKNEEIQTLRETITLLGLLYGVRSTTLHSSSVDTCTKQLQAMVDRYTSINATRGKAVSAQHRRVNHDGE